MDRLPPSRFSFDPKSRIENTTRKRHSHDLVPAAGEKPVLTILEKYGMLNRKMIDDALKIYGHKTINTVKSLRRMQEMGQVNKYTIYSPDPELPDNDVYILSRQMREKCGIESATIPVHDYNMANIPYVLEKLSVNQWHLQMLRHMDGKEVKFNQRVFSEAGQVLIPSLVKIKTRLKRPLHVCAVPVCKGRKKEDIASFVAQIAFLNSYFAENRGRFKSVVVVVLCESERQIGDVSAVIESVNQTAGSYLLFTIDSLVADKNLNPLSLLFHPFNEGMVTTLDTLKLA